MFVPEKLKLNRFVDVNIPDNRSYFTRFGKSVVPTGSYTGDDSAPMPKNKVDTFVDMEEFDRVRQLEENGE